MKYFDLHCDTATQCWEKHSGLREARGHVSLQKASRFEKWAQVFAVFLDDKRRGEEAWKWFQDVSGLFADEMERNSDVASFCRSAADIRRAAADAKEIGLLSIEGSAALAGKMEHLQEAWEAGVRLITLTWNGRCEAGDGCFAENAGGLTPFGFELVREMNRRSMIVDVSHLSEKGFWDVARAAQQPFVASHSDSKAVCGNVRNLTDSQFREIVKGGGLVGINFYRAFLSDSAENASPEDIVRHIDHFLHLGGEKILAMGSDFDGCELPDGIRGQEDMESLYTFVCREFGQEMADAIFWGNAYRFFTENLQ